MNYTTKLITGIRRQFRKKSIARVFREIGRDMLDACQAFCRGLLCVTAAPILFVLAAPIRIAIWMLSPFLSPLFMRVPDSVWANLDSILKK